MGAFRKGGWCPQPVRSSATPRDRLNRGGYNNNNNNNNSSSSSSTNNTTTRCKRTLGPHCLYWLPGPPPVQAHTGSPLAAAALNSRQMDKVSTQHSHQQHRSPLTAYPWLMK